MITRRRFNLWMGGTLLARWVLGAQPQQVDLEQRIAKAQQFLIAQQSPDGAWRSSVYGFHKDGSSLTAHVARALPDAQAVQKAAAFLDHLSKNPDLSYPVYTAADATKVVRGDAWPTLLRRHQLVESLGWSGDDIDYGGWSFAHSPPIKSPQSQGPWSWSNLSSTRYALEALADPSIIKPAMQFIFRCQNFDGQNVGVDGGFFFAPSQAIRNKAGGSVDATGRQRFNSYGSATCDGILALLACRVLLDHPRVQAGRQWLTRNFDVDHHPGQFVPENEDIRDATYFYYLHSLTLACDKLGLVRRYREAIAAALISRQNSNGSWTNRFTDGHEDDPLVATPLALRSLLLLR